MRVVLAILLGAVVGFAAGCLVNQLIGITLHFTVGEAGIPGGQALKALPFVLAIAGSVAAVYIDKRSRRQ